MALQIDLFTGELSLPPPSVELDQWFTRPKVADAFAAWAKIEPGMRVLEPSAGEGALLKSAPEAEWTAVELDTARAEWIERHGWAKEVVNADFLRAASGLIDRFGAFDLVHQNPPYSKGLDTEFVLACIEYRLAPRTTALLATNFLHSDSRSKKIWRWARLTRLGILSTRPQFGVAGGDSDGPKRDYCFFELKMRKRPRRAGESDKPHVTWIDISG